MTEEQILAFFAHVEAVRERWAREFDKYMAEEYMTLTEGGNAIKFLDVGWEENTHGEIPLHAFIDVDAAVRDERARRERERAESEARYLANKEAQDRREYERLRQKFGG